MSEKRIHSNEPRMKKKPDKPLPASYREYLDMDTDEEEFGRQETPEPDEELPPEPEKPIFTDKELETLVVITIHNELDCNFNFIDKVQFLQVQYVQNLTIVSNVGELILSDESIDIIRKYFRNPSHTILTIYYEVSEHRALLDFPNYSNHGLTYFLRSAWQIYTVENFMSTVLYGNINSNMENSVLKFLENIYAPIAFDSGEWPKVTKDQVFSNLNEFLMSLTDATYLPMSLAILYIPREGIKNRQRNVSTNKASLDSMNMRKNNLMCSIDKEDDNGVIERLERVARYWIKQIRGVLCGGNVRSKSAYRTIIDEIQFWNHRFENLSCLQHQLSSESVTSIVHILEEKKSSSVTDFHPLVTEINAKAIEAASNITYLNLLVDYCCDFEVPNGINDYATNILLLIRFIAIESEFYNDTDKIEGLCQSLGTQIIMQCKNQIDLEVVLVNDPQTGKRMLENCIICCEKFTKIFKQLVIMDRTSEFATFSKIDEKNAFCHVNTFVQRCRDLIEVADARIVFDMCDEVKRIGGANAPEHEIQYQKIHKLFHETLDEIKQNRDCILDVALFTWLEQILNFRCQVETVDNMMINLIQNIFDDVLNVEEGLEALYSMKRFVIRKNLRKTLRNYWTFIWNLFDEELKSVIINIDKNAVMHNVSKRYTISTATLMRVKKNYLTRQYNMLIDASDWFDENTSTLIIEKYKRVCDSLTQKENIL